MRQEMVYDLLCELGPCTVSELAEALGIEGYCPQANLRTSINRALRRMELYGLVRKASGGGRGTVPVWEVVE